MINKDRLLNSISKYQDFLDTNPEKPVKVFFRNNESFSYINNTKSDLYIENSTHTYYYRHYNTDNVEINGPLASSANEYIRYYDEKFDFNKLDIPAFVLNRARDRGNKIHKELEEKSSNAFETQLQTRFGIGEINFREIILWDVNNKIVGMIDLIDFEINEDSLTIKMVDHKVSRMDKTELLTYQLNIYRFALKDFFNYLSEELDVEINIILMGNLINYRSIENGYKSSCFQYIEIDLLSDEEVLNIIKVSNEKKEWMD